MASLVTPQGGFLDHKMADPFEMRDCRGEDIASLEKLYPDTFPDEELLPLVRELVSLPSGVLSFVAVSRGKVVGHAVFTMCTIDGVADGTVLLGPLAVSPDWQRRGSGSQLVEWGLGRLESIGAKQVFVLGDPAYYGRFGFRPEPNVQPPYPLPVEWREAWQSINLGVDHRTRQGVLEVPQPWRRPELWGP